MGTSLTGLTPATTYDALIKVGDNGPIDGTLKALSDGLGNNLPMEASTSAINFTSTLTQGGVALQPVLVSGTNIKTINSTSLLGSGDVAVQPTLVSGTNIKTINGTTILGSGDLATPSPSGVSGAIQFSNGSAFASDATNLFWDNTNKRLGVGTNAPSATGHFQSVGNQLWLTNSGDIYTYLKFSANGGFLSMIFGDGSGNINYLNNYAGGMWASNKFAFGPSYFTPSGQVHIKGSGSTSATTSLLVQNSAGTEIANFRDDLSVRVKSEFRVLDSAGNNAMIMWGDGFGGPKLLWVNGSLGVGVLGNNASAIVQADSTTQGFLPPRMTDTQRAAIASPAEGLLLFNTTNKGVAYRDGTNWGYLSGAPQTVAASGGTVNVSFASGNIIDMTLTASTTLTFAGHVVGTYIFELTQGGSGSYTITWPASVKWSGGIAPALTTTVGKTDIVTLFHDGTNFYGTYSLNY